MLKKLSLTTSFLLVIAASLQAMDLAPYTPAAYDKAVEAEKTIILDFHASWCPTCRAQEKALKSLTQDSDLAEVIVFKVDYDTEKEMKQAWKITGQSTLVRVIDGKEAAKVRGITSVPAIKSFILGQE